MDKSQLSLLLVTHVELSGSLNLLLTGAVRLEIDFWESRHKDDAVMVGTG